jgi:TetR/AcrR family transcriptional regulator of autoinduction and epiphytic fitness
MLQAREDAIIAAVNRLLAQRGYDAMTVDAVAAEVGVAKASLYKHFKSKEELAAAAMTAVLQRALQRLAELQRDAQVGNLERLRSITRWALRLQLAGEMPALPAQNSALRAALAADRGYLDGIVQVSEILGAWIVAEQAAGRLDAELPPEVVLYTLYARACDPVLALLKAGGLYDDEQVVELVLATCFGGLEARAAGARALPRPTCA